MAGNICHMLDWIKPHDFKQFNSFIKWAFCQKYLLRSNIRMIICVDVRAAGTL